MTYPPGQTLSIRDGGIGSITNATILPLVVGRTSSGTDLAVTTHYSPQSVRDALGEGPAVELAAMCAEVGGCHVLRVAGTTAGTASAVTATRVGTSTGTVTVPGAAPFDAYSVKIAITATGTLGTARYKLSLDGGTTFGGERIIPLGGTAALGSSNVTASFFAGAGPAYFEVGDVHSFTCVAPTFSSAELTAAFASGSAAHAFLRGSTVVEQIFLAGRQASAAAAGTIGAVLETVCNSLASDNVFVTYIADAGNDTASNVRSAGVVSTIASARGAYAHGTATRPTANPGEGWGSPALPLAYSAAVRAAVVDPAENLGRRRSGPLTGVTAVSNDEGIAPAFLESDRIITATSRRGNAGFYITNGYTRSAADSDFIYYDYSRLIARVCRLVVGAQSRWILSKVRTRTDGTGRIAEVDAKRIEAAVQSVLDELIMKQPNSEGFSGFASAVRYTVDRSNNILATRQLLSSVAVIPLPPIESITTTVGLATEV